MNKRQKKKMVRKIMTKTFKKYINKFDIKQTIPQTPIYYKYVPYFCQKNTKNPALPAIHAFERYAIKEYQPIQGKLIIKKP